MSIQNVIIVDSRYDSNFLLNAHMTYSSIGENYTTGDDVIYESRFITVIKLSNELISNINQDGKITSKAINNPLFMHPFFSE